MSKKLDTVWFVCVPPENGAGIVYGRPAKSAQEAWNNAAHVMNGEAFFEEPTDSIESTIRWMRRAGYRARRCVITEA